MGWVVFIMILLNGFYIYLGSESTYHGIKMAFEPKKPRFLLFLLILTDMDLLLRGKSNVEIMGCTFLHFVELCARYNIPTLLWELNKVWSYLGYVSVLL